MLLEGSLCHPPADGTPTQTLRLGVTLRASQTYSLSWDPLEIGEHPDKVAPGLSQRPSTPKSIQVGAWFSVLDRVLMKPPTVRC